MIADENLDLKRLIASISSTAEPERQAEIINNAFSKTSVRQVAEIWHEISKKALDDLGYAKALLLFMDLPVLNKVMGRKTVGQYLFTFKGSEKYKELADIAEQIGGLDDKIVKLLKAKAAMLFQLLYLVRDRVQEEGLPALRISATDLIQRLLGDPELNAKKIKVDLNVYGKAYWNMLIEQLKEADFQSKDGVIFEMLLTDSLVEQYQTGSILASSGSGGAGEARLSDAVLVRFGTNIIKRLNLLLRTTQMYQSADHPSVSAALESLLATIENAMQGREGLTLTRLGGDLLIEDIKIKKKEKFLEDFLTALEQRNVNAMTLKRGISLEEVRAFLMIFAQTDAQIKKQGGVKTILESKGVSHVMVDQFRYGIISSDHEEADNLGADEKLISNVVFAEVINKIQSGDIDKLSPAELGSMIKEMLSGSMAKDKNARRSLAQMILSLDPDLAEAAVFSKTGLREEMSWSSARKMIEQLLEDLGKGGPDQRISTLENIEKMAELAISRNKETSLVAIIDRLTDRLRNKERDTEVLSRLFDTFGNLTRYLVLNGKYAPALKIVRSVSNMVNYLDNLPAEKKDDYTRAVCELGEMMKVAVSTAEIIQALGREMEGDNMTQIDNAMKILEVLGTEKVISELLDFFKSPQRSLRNRAYQILTALGEKTLLVSNWKLKHLGDPMQFQRRREEGELTEDSYYVARNCIELVSRLGSKRDLELLRSVSDDHDPRIRAEVIEAIAKLDQNEGVLLAKMRLHDSDPVVAEASINILGQMGGPDDLPALVDLFYAEPRLRIPVVNALGRIGGEEAENLLSGAAHYRMTGTIGKIFTEDDDLRVAALKAAGAIGREKSRAALRRFIRVGGNFVLGALLVPMQMRKKKKDWIKTAGESLSRIEFRLKSHKTT